MGGKRFRLSEYANYITSGSRGWAEYYADDGDVFVRITNLRRASISPDWSDTKHVRLPVGMNEGTRTRLVKNDILISITADLGIVGFIEDEPAIPHYINQHVALVRSSRTDAYPKFVAYYLASDFMQRSISSVNDAGIKAGLNLPTIRGVRIWPAPIGWSGFSLSA
jgi:type I restriction enzyme, S subunit